jgi:hypothetical protein
VSKTRPDAESHSAGLNLDLEGHAIAQQFVADDEAAPAPRLTTYTLRSPRHAQGLAALVME